MLRIKKEINLDKLGMFGILRCEKKVTRDYTQIYYEKQVSVTIDGIVIDTTLKISDTHLISLTPFKVDRNQGIFHRKEVVYDDLLDTLFLWFREGLIEE